MGKRGLIEMDWRNIRSLNGSQANGFEELCTQLARSEIPQNAKFTRKGSPDAGIECFCVLSDGSEWGWQAKYFDTIGRSQWSQVDKSVRAALEKHPALSRYFICVPLDRPDARVGGRISALQAWENHVEAWKAYAREQGREVDFVWWGSSELIEQLNKTEHIGRLWFWFEKRVFDNGWFQSRLDEALISAGPRYTPEIHFELPIAQDLNGFGRADSFINNIKTNAKRIREEFQNLNYSHNNQKDSVYNSLIDKLEEAVEIVLQSLAQLSCDPSGELPIQIISEQICKAEQCNADLYEFFSQQSREYYDAYPQHQEDRESTMGYSDPFSSSHFHVNQLSDALNYTQKIMDHADKIVNSQLMILSGNAGTGKTHLLCDFAKKRIDAGAPTILLMGQRFLSVEHPWQQARQQLDLADTSIEQFVGALEAAAQVAGRRALVIVDALNEGQGRTIWPPHLAALLAPLQASPWTAIIVSVRSSYESLVIPEEIRSEAVRIVHEGFEDHEYDATHIFFSYYNLAFPSTPILQPEFKNPLFLKIICEGLSKAGEQSLPRGLHGITAIFKFYIDSVNQRLARELEYDPRDHLIEDALKKVADHLIRDRKLFLPRNSAKAAVNSVLPGRNYEKSLYCAMISENILIEEMPWQGSQEEDSQKEFVRLSYEKFTDHVVADALLTNHLDLNTPQEAFRPGGGLAFINGPSYVPSGWIEALCIQVPEKTAGQELVSLVPDPCKVWNLRAAFLQSIVWRSLNAFSNETFNILSKLLQTRYNHDDVLDIILTVTTLEEHPYNAKFLDRYLLRQYSMPDRDAWWSIYLHRVWDTKSAVDRLVAWAFTIQPDTKLEDSVAELSGITLIWTLTTSNRFLRDKATKSLVCLLTGRPKVLERLIEHFADIDDPYISERIYAVAYGVVMRTNDLNQLEILATKVYKMVFASGSPPAHILLRDYARGVVERALYLGIRINVDKRLICPPYKTKCPEMPSEEMIKSYLKPIDFINQESVSYSRIKYSLGNHGDFARYIIGTNNSSGSNWLTISPEKSLQALPKINSSLNQSNSNYLKLSSIQRYIFKRVFDLGWRSERFDEFDSHIIYNRKVSTERIGKKYQWIAYHEILAYIADNYQYFHRYNDDRKYNGPWQIPYCRDIDPSVTFSSIPGGAGYSPHKSSWWAPVSYETWGETSTALDWIKSKNDIPNIKNLLIVRNSQTELDWLNLDGDFRWEQLDPFNVDPYCLDRKRLFLTFTGYFVHRDHVNDFMTWAKTKEFPHSGDTARNFLGEYGWSPAFHAWNRPDNEYGNLAPSWDHSCPVHFYITSAQHLCERSGNYDWSLDDTFYLQMPSSDLIKKLNLKWTGDYADFVDDQGNRVAFDPTAHEDGPTALLIRKDMMRHYLHQTNLALCWTVLGEKLVMRLPSSSQPYQGRLRITGVYTLKGEEVEGDLKYSYEKPTT